MLTNGQKEEIIYHLNSWVSGSTPKIPYWGLCGNLEYLIKINPEKQLGTYFKSWGKFNGNLRYPVPGGRRLYHTTIDKFDFTIPYNQDRRELMIHIISEMEKELGI